MQAPHGRAGSGTDEAFAGAAERFFELLKTFGMTASAQSPDWAGMAAPLARQFEQWLRLSQSAAPWFGVGDARSPGPVPGMGIPLGPAAVQGKDAQRTLEHLGRLAQLQGELAAHWSEVASGAAQRFVARLGAKAAPPTTLDQALKLYELWVSCAEEAYAATVHKEDFGRLQAQIANTSAALLAEQRRHVDSMARTFGLPTRAEVDELYAQLKELRQRLDEPSGARRASAASPGAKRKPSAPSRARTEKAPGARAKRGRGATRTSPKRTRRPRP
jgi:hypothetical protein